MPRRRTVLCVLLILLTVAVYGRACGFGFVGIDDGRYVSKNVHVLGGLHAGSVRWAWTTLFDGNWFPLTWLSLMADSSLYGPYPGGFHFTNIVLHVFNVLLVFSLFVAMTGNQLRSALVAVLFAVHPIHVESVAFISERKDVLSIFFGLLALNAYVRFAGGRGVVWWAASFCLFLCSLLAKQTLVTLPCLLLLLDFWPLARLTKESFWRRLLEKSPFAVVAAAFCVIAYRASLGRSNPVARGNAFSAAAAQRRFVLWPLFVEDRGSVEAGLFLSASADTDAFRRRVAGARVDRRHGRRRGGGAASAVSLRGVVLVFGDARAAHRSGADRAAADGRSVRLFSGDRTLCRGSLVGSGPPRSNRPASLPAPVGDGRRRSLRGVGICSNRLLAGQRHAVSSCAGCRRG